MENALPPQPPPDIPAPPPGDEAEDSRLKWKMIRVVGGVAIAFSVYYLTIALPISRTQNRKHTARALSTARSNIRQVHMALFDFEDDYGTFPDASTIANVRFVTSTTIPLGSANSNELFRQLIATDTANDEKIFWARTESAPRQPNDILGADTLKKGECSFTYIAGLSSSSDPTAPVAMAPVIPGTQQFDPKPFNGKALVLSIDGSAKAEPIDKHGHVMIGGMNLFDPRQPYWRGKKPEIKWPE
jgi:hypothetical protein